MAEEPKVDSVHYYRVFTYSIQSYVQLPGDSLEYKKIKVYVQLMPKTGHVSIIRPEKIYLGNYLKPTGRKFKTLIGDEVFGIENRELTMMDKMLNIENNFEI